MAWPEERQEPVLLYEISSAWSLSGPGNSGAIGLTRLGPRRALPSVADLNRPIDDVTVLRRHGFSDELAIASRRIGAPVPFGVVSGGSSKGRRNRNDHGRSRRSKKQIFQNGFDVKIIREVIRLRKQDPRERDELETMVEEYWQAINRASLEGKKAPVAAANGNPTLVKSS